MPRREFSKKTQREAIKRAGFRCEAIAPNGLRCPTKVGKGSPVEYDHIIPDSMDGGNSLENCQCLCKLCHKIKTALDASDRAEAKGRFDSHNGIRDPHKRKLVSRGFEKAAPQRQATKPSGKPRLPPRNLYVPALEQVR